MKVWLEERIVPDKDIMYCHDYYSEPGVREIAHAMKNGDSMAIHKAAKDMAKFVNEEDILVPIPSRNGRATTTLLLAKAIAKISGSKVANILSGNDRQALYDLKKEGGKVNDDFFGYRTKRNPKKSNVVLIDNVYATGATANAASNSFNNARVLVYAKDSTATPAWKMAEKRKHMKVFKNKQGFSALREYKIRLLEDKNRLIDKLDLTDEQKDAVKTFFKKHPNYENKIDWNRKDLKWDDFVDVLAFEGKSRNQARKNGIAGLKEGKDYKFIASGETSDGHPYEIYMPLSYLGSVTLADDKSGPAIVGKWCIASNDDNYWKDYTERRGDYFYFVYIYGALEGEPGTKFALQCEDGGLCIWDAGDHDVFDKYGKDEKDLLSSEILEFLKKSHNHNFDYGSQLTDAVSQNFDKMKNILNELAEGKINSMRANYDKVASSFFTENGWFNTDKFYEIANIIGDMPDRYVRQHPVHIMVPSNYPYEVFPNITNEEDLDKFTMEMSTSDYDDWDVNIWSFVDCLDLSQTNITEIDSSFSDCGMCEIRNIIFPKTLKKIGDKALEVFYQIKVLDFRNTQLSHIGNWGLIGGTILEEVYLPNTIRSFGWRVFPNRRTFRRCHIDLTRDEFLNRLHESQPNMDAFDKLSSVFNEYWGLILTFTDGEYRLLQLLRDIGNTNPEIKNKVVDLENKLKAAREQRRLEDTGKIPF